jgi:hypothetical protein
MLTVVDSRTEVIVVTQEEPGPSPLTSPSLLVFPLISLILMLFYWSLIYR